MVSLIWHGHIIRMRGEFLSKVITDWTLTVGRKRSKLKKTLKSTREEILNFNKSCGSKITEWTEKNGE